MEKVVYSLSTIWKYKIQDLISCIKYFNHRFDSTVYKENINLYRLELLTILYDKIVNNEKDIVLCLRKNLKKMSKNTIKLTDVLNKCDCSFSKDKILNFNEDLMDHFIAENITVTTVTVVISELSTQEKIDLIIKIFSSIGMYSNDKTIKEKSEEVYSPYEYYQISDETHTIFRDSIYGEFGDYSNLDYEGECTPENIHNKRYYAESAKDSRKSRESRDSKDSSSKSGYIQENTIEGYRGGSRVSLQTSLFNSLRVPTGSTGHSEQITQEMDISEDDVDIIYQEEIKKALEISLAESERQYIERAAKKLESSEYLIEKTKLEEDREIRRQQDQEYEEEMMNSLTCENAYNPDYIHQSDVESTCKTTYLKSGYVRSVDSDKITEQLDALDACKSSKAFEYIKPINKIESVVESGVESESSLPTPKPLDAPLTLGNSEELPMEDTLKSMTPLERRRMLAKINADRFNATIS